MLQYVISNTFDDDDDKDSHHESLVEKFLSTHFLQVTSPPIMSIKHTFESELFKIHICHVKFYVYFLRIDRENQNGI